VTESHPPPEFLQPYQPTPLEVRSAQWRRVGASLVFGLLLSVVYALVAGTIDALTFPGLPLRVSWPELRQEMLFTVLGGLALSVITAWPANNWKGIAFGAGAIVCWEMLRSFLRVGPAVVILLLLVLPMVVVSLPIAAVFRWAVAQYIGRLQDRRLGWRVGLVTALIVLGAFAGSWSRMSSAAEGAVRQVNTMMQKTLANAGGDLPMPLATVPDFHQRAGQTYTLSQHASTASPTGVDVRVTFDNGYVVTCFVDTAANSSTCAEGTQSPFGSARYNPGEQR
jgi:hypothetical protein